MLNGYSILTGGVAQAGNKLDLPVPFSGAVLHITEMQRTAEIWWRFGAVRTGIALF